MCSHKSWKNHTFQITPQILWLIILLLPVSIFHSISDVIRVTNCCWEWSFYGSRKLSKWQFSLLNITLFCCVQVSAAHICSVMPFRLLWILWMNWRLLYFLSSSLRLFAQVGLHMPKIFIYEKCQLDCILTWFVAHLILFALPSSLLKDFHTSKFKTQQGTQSKF